MPSDSLDLNGQYRVEVTVTREICGHSITALGIAHTPNKRDLKHLCGLTGYNPMLGDSCPRCDLNNQASAKARQTLDRIEKERLAEQEAQDQHKQAVRNQAPNPHNMEL